MRLASFSPPEFSWPPTPVTLPMRARLPIQASWKLSTLPTFQSINGPTRFIDTPLLSSLANVDHNRIESQ